MYLIYILGWYDQDGARRVLHWACGKRRRSDWGGGSRERKNAHRLSLFSRKEAAHRQHSGRLPLQRSVCVCILCTREFARGVCPCNKILFDTYRDTWGAIHGVRYIFRKVHFKSAMIRFSLIRCTHIFQIEADFPIHTLPSFPMVLFLTETTLSLVHNP